MTIKIKKILNSQGALAQLANAHNLPVALRYKVVKLMRHISTALEPYEELRLEKCKEYSDGKTKTVFNKHPVTGADIPSEEYDIKPEFQAKWEQELIEMRDQEVEIDLPDINMTEFEAVPDLPASTFTPLDWVVKV